MEATPDNSIPPPVALDGRCPGCDYDLSGMPSGRCTECGGAFLAPDAETLLRIQRAREAFLKRWRWVAAPGWAFTVGIAAWLFIGLWGAGGGRLLMGAVWIAALALLSVPPKRLTSENHGVEARAYRAFWLTMAPLLHATWSIPLTVLLLLRSLPTGWKEVLASIGFEICVVFVPASWIALGTVWSVLFEALALTRTRLSLSVLLLLLIGGLGGLSFLAILALGGW